VHRPSVAGYGKRYRDCKTYRRKQSNHGQPVINRSGVSVNEAGVYSNEDHSGCSTYENEIDGYQVWFADFRVDETESQLAQDIYHNLVLECHTWELAMRPLHQVEGTSSLLSTPRLLNPHLFDNKAMNSQLINVQKKTPTLGSYVNANLLFVDDPSSTRDILME
jgi:hypothetical protein